MKKLDETILRTVFDFAYGDKTTGKDPKHTREFLMAVAGQEPDPVEHRAVLKAIYKDANLTDNSVYTRLRDDTQKLRCGINRELDAVYGDAAVRISNLHGIAWKLAISDEFRQLLSGASETDVRTRLKAWQEEKGKRKRVGGKGGEGSTSTINDQLARVPNSEFIRVFRFQKHGIVARIHEQYALELDTETRVMWECLATDRLSHHLVPYYPSTGFRVVHPPAVRDTEIVLDVVPINWACFIAVEDPSVLRAVKEHTVGRIKDIAGRMPQSFRESHQTLNAYNPVPLGTQIVIITREGKTLLRKRGASVAISPDAWGVSVGGYCGDNDKVKEALDVGRTVEKELGREVGVLTSDPGNMLFTGFHRNTSTGAVSILGFWRLQADVDELVSVLTDKYPGEGKVFDTTPRTAENFVYDFQNIVVDFTGRAIAKALAKAGSSVLEMVPECLVALMLALEANGQSASKLLG